MKTVARTVRMGLCCSCGICKGICPKGCISWDRKDGLYIPHIDEQLCVNCGLCAAVCPGLGHHYDQKETAQETVTGPVQACFNAWSRDPQLRHVSASGGVVSTVIRELLEKGVYDGAFCLDTYDYRTQLKTRLYTAQEVSLAWERSNAPKSRYLPVSHENALAYMKEHRDKRVILVATSCAVRGLLAAIQRLNIKRENYLLIGLFCDKVFNYNSFSYFEDAYAAGKPLKALHFKNKESGGWPGDMKFFPETGEPFYVPLAERAKAKAYFMPERCLYCVDKLNACADISLGDNYTGIHESALGSNSVILRTQAGMDAWAVAQSKLEVRQICIADIQKAQAIDLRLKNLYCGDCKTAQTEEMPDLNAGVPREIPYLSESAAWKHSLDQLRAGAVYHTAPSVLKKQLKKDHKKPNPAIRLMKRAVRYIRRKLK